VIARVPRARLHRLVVLLCMLVATLWLAAPRAAEAPRDAAGLVAVPPLARVTDLAGALKPADMQALEAKLAAYEVAKGSQIAIIVVPTTQPEPIADFAQRVGDAWKIGRKGVGDGVLITVAIEDRRVWISVARSLEGALPDVVATRISREVIAPRFREGDYGGGLLAGLDAILRRLDGEALPPPAPSAAAGRVDVGGDVVPILLGVVLAGIGVGSALRRMFGVPGAAVVAGGSGFVTNALLTSALLGGLAGLVVFIGSLMAGQGGGGGGRVLGGRRHGGGTPIFIPGGWSGGGRGGGWGGGGGWSSGGGGDFAGGGGGSSW
jgi:uncharacterized protein